MSISIAGSLKRAPGRIARQVQAVPGRTEDGSEPSGGGARRRHGGSPFARADNAQREERDSGRPSLAADGSRVHQARTASILHPQTLSGAFERAAKKAGLPPIGIHGLRHSHASLGLANNVPLVIMSERLGTLLRGDHWRRLQPLPAEPAPGGGRRHRRADRRGALRGRTSPRSCANRLNIASSSRSSFSSRDAASHCGSPRLRTSFGARQAEIPGALVGIRPDRAQASRKPGMLRNGVVRR